GGGGDVGHLADHVVGAGRGRAEHVGRRLGQVARPLRRRHDDGAGPVGDEATVELVERRRLERRGQHLVDGGRIAVAGLWGPRRRVARADGDLGQLLRRGAELVHVPGGGEGVGADGRQHAGRHLPLEAGGGRATGGEGGLAGGPGEGGAAPAAGRPGRGRVDD